MEFHPGLLFAGALGSGALLLPTLPRLACPVQALFALPCLTCGSSRLLDALLQGQILAAFAFNPLVFAALITALAFCAGWALQLTVGLRVMLTGVPSLPFRFLAVVLVVANYSWLLVAGI